MLIAVDIDGVLTIETKGHGYQVYKNRTPRLDNIEILRQQKEIGNRIVLYTSRYIEDERITIDWLKKYEVEYDEIIFNKPQAEVYIDDKSLPYVELNLNEYLNYNFHHSCWRFKYGFISSDEKHPCFFCGFQIDISVNDCLNCGIMPCPSCKKCLCNIPLLTYITLIRIHKKYCCNLPEFDGKIKLSGFVDNDLICNCEKTLIHCKNLEGI